MERCDKPAGRFRVTFKYLYGDYGDDRPGEIGDFNADIGEHQECPRVSEAEPFIGELCEHEVSWLRQIPGKAYSIHRRYTVERLD